MNKPAGYANRAAAIKAAKRELKNPTAKVGVDFTVYEKDGRHHWEVDAVADAKPAKKVAASTKQKIKAAPKAAPKAGDQTPAAVRKVFQEIKETRVKADVLVTDSTGHKYRGQWRAKYEQAAAGTVPEAPDFSANTHKPFRRKLAAVVELVEAKDIAGLKAFEINPVSTSPKAIARYRDLCVLALETGASV